MPRRFFAIATLIAISLVSLFAQTTELTIVNSGPNGELQERQQADEVRIVFSEPMVALGRIPENPSIPFVRIAPAIQGTFRWSGTTILIFTPAAPLPFATRYSVTVDASAESAAGRRLRAPYSFTFTTPTVRMIAMRWARKTERFDSPVTMALGFNQPVRPDDVLPHVTVAYLQHQFDAPAFSSAERARLTASDPDGLRRFDQKVAEARRNAARRDRVTVRVARDWDRAVFKSIDDTIVMLETVDVPPPGTTLGVTLGERVPSAQGREVPGITQTTAARLANAFFVLNVNCQSQCTPSRWNPLQFSGRVTTPSFAAALSAVDITEASREQAVPKKTASRSSSRDGSNYHNVEDGGLDRQPAARTWMLRLAESLTADDGQTLGYPWIGIVENWNELAFTSFGDGHGVWEVDGGPQLPFYSRNFRSAQQWMTPISPAELMPKLLELESKHFELMPPGNGTTRPLAVRPNQIQSFGFDVGAGSSKAKTGIYWAGLTPLDPLARTEVTKRTTSTLIQVTNLGITVKDSPQSTLIFVTSLDKGEPVESAAVSIVNASNTTVWRGKTNRDGLALAPALALRTPGAWNERTSFIVLAEKSGDTAYVVSDWNEGISPWEFNSEYNIWEATDILRGSVFTDRGVYKPGEAVQVKAILRSDTPSGVQMLRPGAPLDVVVRDARNKEVDKRRVTLNRWSSVEWSWSVPTDATLGQYRIEARIPGSLPPEGNDVQERRPNGSWLKAVNGNFLVAAYRRPDFEVTATLKAEQAFAGAPLQASVTAKYLFGGTMAKRPVKWSLTRSAVARELPASIPDKYTDDDWSFLYWPGRTESAETRIAGERGVLNASGSLNQSFSTDRNVDLPYRYTFEADVEDLSRQHIANRATVLVHPASFYLGLRRPARWPTTKSGVTTELIALDLNGLPVAGVTATVSLVRQQWNSVRRAEGSGFYNWDSERIEIPAGEWTITTGERPVPISMAIPEGGSYLVRVVARDRDGRRTRTELSTYVMGDGYTAWERYDDNRISLEPEKKTLKPGETARVMIKSPWERATALLTIEREGIRQYRRFALTSTQQTVDIPVTEKDIPNVYVSVLLIRGRTSAEPSADGGDPGKPAFRLGYTELSVVDESKLLGVKVAADREEYRPANSAKVSVAVTDALGKAARSEVTLWAVDTGVLALTNYSAPDVARAIYARKALQVMNEDSRQRVISRRVLTPKGAGEGGGGGDDAAARTDFRPLAFWLGSVETDRSGKATRTVTLPDSLTSYRIMAVAGDQASRFGSGTASVRVTKPVTLLPAFPRFLALTDAATFSALVGNTQKAGAQAVVSIRSLDPSLLEFPGGTSTTIDLPAGATTTVRFGAVARGVGRPRVRVSVTANGNSDAFEMAVPIIAVARMETNAAFGETTDRAIEKLSIPAGVVTTAGGLQVDLASSALVGLGEGARYLADYPYGCAEQKASAALALALAADLGSAFSMGRITPAEYRARAQSLLNELPRYQCADGGFGYWPGRCQFGNFYLTSYVLHVMRVTKQIGLESDTAVIGPALSFLAAQLRANPPAEVQWLPAWSAGEAFGVKVLAEYGSIQDANITRLVANVDRMPIFALSYLADAMAAGQTRHARYADVVRRISNAIRIEGDRAHAEELDTDELRWLWNSNVRTSALVLEGFVRRGDNASLVPGLVRSLLLARQNGRWNNTQENAVALEALVFYYKKFESVEPDLTATVQLGGKTLGTAAFKGRTSASQSVRLAMPELLSAVAGSAANELSVSRTGAGRLYYTARLQYVPTTPPPANEQGIRVERRFERVAEGAESTAPSTSFAAGDLVRVTLAFSLPKERRFVAVTDPVAAGFEPVDGWFKTTASDLARDASSQSGDASWLTRWRRGGFDYIDKFDDRVTLFATRLSEGRHEFSYVVRAITPGTFNVAGTWAEEMYSPEVNGRSAPARVVIK